MYEKKKKKKKFCFTYMAMWGPIRRIQLVCFFDVIFLKFFYKITYPAGELFPLEGRLVIWITCEKEREMLVTDVNGDNLFLLYTCESA